MAVPPLSALSRIGGQGDVRSTAGAIPGCDDMTRTSAHTHISVGRTAMPQWFAARAKETILMLINTLVAASVAAVLLVSGVAAAAEVTGAIKGWDTKSMMLTLDNDVAYLVPTNLQTSTDILALGNRVTLVFDVDPLDATRRSVTKIAIAPIGAPRP
jgi:hypothetical protein